MDPARVHELAGRVRQSADAVAAQVPLAGGPPLKSSMESSSVAQAFDDAVIAMDRVFGEYHANTLRHFADTADRAATAVEEQDEAHAHELTQTGGR